MYAENWFSLVFGWWLMSTKVVTFYWRRNKKRWRQRTAYIRLYFELKKCIDFVYNVYNYCPIVELSRIIRHFSVMSFMLNCSCSMPNTNYMDFQFQITASVRYRYMQTISKLVHGSDGHGKMIIICLFCKRKIKEFNPVVKSSFFASFFFLSNAN